MSKIWLPVLVASMMLAGVAQAQTRDGDITMSTDPARAAAVEQHAAQLQQRQSPSNKTAHKNAHKSSHAAPHHATTHAAHNATQNKAAKH